jgi:hypothetical protein
VDALNRSSISSVTTIERFLSDGKDECTPAIHNHAANGCPKRVRMSALEFRLAETLGGAAKPGWSPRKGQRLSPFLGGNCVAIRSTFPFLFLNPQFTARWSLRCQLQ